MSETIYYADKPLDESIRNGRALYKAFSKQRTPRSSYPYRLTRLREYEILEKIAKLGKEVAEFYANHKHWDSWNDDWDAIVNDCEKLTLPCGHDQVAHNDWAIGCDGKWEVVMGGKLARQKLAEIKTLTEELEKLQ